METQNIFERNKRLAPLKKFIEVNNILMTIMGFILFSVMTVIVFMRYFLHKEVNAALEYLYFALVWLFFLGACNASYEKSHLRADTLEVLLKNETALLVVEWIKQVLQLFLHIVFLFFSISFIKKAIALPAYTDGLRLPLLIGYSAIPYGAVTMLIYTSIHFVDFVWSFFRRNKEKTDYKEGKL